MLVHTLIIGSGAAGLCAAARLRAEGVDNILIATEGLDKGTSINTGSDKQTYYKLSLCGDQSDSPRQLAQTLFDGGSMHGDIALIEAALSARCFLHLVNLGVKFPTDAFGQFVGYKTDHDPRQRATSVGPYTSRDMCRVLIQRAKELRVPILEGVRCIELLKIKENGQDRACGAVFDGPDGPFPIIAENVVLAVGGPGDLYETSVYPESQRSSIGLALAIGAEAHNLPESQFGLASTNFRWNVSGTYMQVVPRFVSTDRDGNDPKEFLVEYFGSACPGLTPWAIVCRPYGAESILAPTGRQNLAQGVSPGHPANLGDLYSKIFLKGYQWPFDTKKVLGGSSIIDILVYIETVERRRRVFLDFRSNPQGFDGKTLSDEARNYLEKSNALFGTPIERLKTMNPAAIELYAVNGIDLRSEMLEVAVCAQHNNGGLAGTIWWESTNIKHLFPIGEVNGSHGVARPGGSALNSGQVGAFRAAEFIANRYSSRTLDKSFVLSTVQRETDRSVIQRRMSQYGGAIRNLENLESAVRAAWEQIPRDSQCLAHAVYLDAVLFAVRSGVGSRGSGLVLSGDGTPIHTSLGNHWKMQPEDESFREKVLVTRFDPETGTVNHRWELRRPIPENDLWFETAWKDYRNGDIYRDDSSDAKEPDA